MRGLNVHADEQGSAGNSEKKKWYKSPKIIFGAAILIAIPVVGTTLANPGGNVTVNDGNVTLGQGEAGVLPCDDSVFIHPRQAYNSGWTVDQVTITDFNLTTTTNGTGCGGANIVLHATAGVGTSPLDGGTVAFSCDHLGSVTIPDYYENHSWGPHVVCTPAGDLTKSTVTITWDTDPLSSLISGFAISQG
jgi:hypothetical protein